MKKTRTRKPKDAWKTERPKTKVALHWYNQLEREIRDHDETRTTLEGVRETVKRIDGMYQRMDGRLSAIRVALGVIVGFDPDRWSAQLKMFELPDKIVLTRETAPGKDWTVS